ncbi:hypothetical protein [Streptomyces sp. CC228A]|uniref:hypothetical protein n=1 Tax=Streptomyces sp. CC228A TaxID=2898186 RepID=UPI001F3EF126|nr:hypothetical protein [Streptomyces sp. CC228A]
MSADGAATAGPARRRPLVERGEGAWYAVEGAYGVLIPGQREGVRRVTADGNSPPVRAELPTYLAAQQTKPQGMAAAEFTEPDPARVVHTVERALADRLPAEQGAALRARLNLDALEPGLRETLAGLRREVDGTADAGDALRSAVAARLADQRAAPMSAA